MDRILAGHRRLDGKPKGYGKNKLTLHVHLECFGLDALLVRISRFSDARLLHRPVYHTDALESSDAYACLISGLDRRFATEL